MTRLAAILVALFALAGPLFAQDDKSLIENWLQDNLSVAGRAVQVTGFAGALSSRATMEELTIADAEGVWITLRGAELDWTRSAMIRGRLEVNKLTARELDIARKPLTEASQPSAEASDFALPELPISINIGEVSIDRVTLGATVLGRPVAMQLTGSANLEGGAGAADLSLTRIDGETGALLLTGSYANETRVLALDMSLKEGAGGIVAGLTGLPGGPPLALNLAGTGPINEFTADMNLSTDGVQRLAGELRLSPGTVTQDGIGRACQAELAGDPTALVAADLRGFFGTDTQLSAAGEFLPDGRLDLSRLHLTSAAMAVTGEVQLAANRWPTRADLIARIAGTDGAPVRLPIPGEPTRLGAADLAFSYDAATGDRWQAQLAVTGLDRPDMALAQVTLTAQGTMDAGLTGGIPSLDGDVNINAAGISLDDSALAAAVGTGLQARSHFNRDSGAPLALTGLSLVGEDYGLSGDVTLGTDVGRLDVIASGDVTLTAASLARFSGLAGQSLTGAAELNISGQAALPGGAFALEVDGQATDFGLGLELLDRFFEGEGALDIAVARDTQGTQIERFQIVAPGATASLTGTLRSEGSDIAATFELPDATLLLPGLDGAMTLAGTARQEADLWKITANAAAPDDTTATLDGEVILGDEGLDRLSGTLTANLPRLAVFSELAGRQLGGEATATASGFFAPSTGAFAMDGSATGRDLRLDLGDLDSLFKGGSTADFALRRDDAGQIIVDRFGLTTPELDVSALARVDNGSTIIEGQTRLKDLGLIVPGLSGAFTASGQGQLADENWQVRATGSGPGGTTIRASGQVASNLSRADMGLTGQAPLALANSFIAPRQLSGMASYDLNLNGPLAIGSLSGTVRANGARATLPTYRLALDPLDVTAQLAGGRATLDAQARASTGGRITATGPVGLSAPFPADLAIRLNGLQVTDPTLYDLTTDGTLALAGPLTGGARLSGALDLRAVELRIPETGLGATAGLENLQHIGEPADALATRARAGRTATENETGPVIPYGLDLSINAPGAIFLRGRGLDAEFGGSFRIGGTTADVIPQGGFRLIRGRLDFLGNRLTLTEGNIAMRGNFDPSLQLVAETDVDDVAVRVTLDGRASDPVVVFSSNPDLPEDEILARLVFGRGLDQISPLQAIKLASAIATLSGAGGAGTVDKLRSGFGLDDLDVTTDETGTLAVTTGTYIGENLYTDVTIGADGKSEVSINLSITPQITAKGGLTSDGNSSLGLFFEKDF